MKAYVFLANGFEEMEVAFPVSILRAAGIDVTTVSISDDICVIGSHGISIIADSVFNDLNLFDAEVIILPGGQPGTTNLSAFIPLKEVVLYYAKNGIVAAICAAPSILGEMGILEGKKAVCYPGYETLLKGAIIESKEVVVDDNIVTAKGPGVAKEFSYALVKKLLNFEDYERVRLIFE